MTDATRLSTQEYWESWFVEAPTEEVVEPSTPNTESRKRKALLSILGPRLFASLRDNYAHALGWRVLYPAYLPKQAGLKFLELGSAPGTTLVKVRDEFGYEPFGIEYTVNGVKQNRALFARNGIEPDHVIHADFLSEEVSVRYGEQFDIVYSGGLIEHFTNVQEVIDRHIELLAPNGLLMIVIPNLRGMNYLLTRLVNPKILQWHNLAIMDKKVFSSLFEGKQLRQLYCDYYGTINLPLFFTDNKRFKKVVDRTFALLQLPLNLVLNELLLKRGKRFESKFTSPYLIYIGRKTA